MKYKNNPFNIRSGSIPFNGQIGSKNGFCEFNDIVLGVRACLYLLLCTYPRRRWFTIKDIISHFAPAADGNNTNAYINFVCSNGDVKIKPSDTFHLLSLERQYIIVSRMALMETGYKLDFKLFCKSYSLL